MCYGGDEWKDESWKYIVEDSAVRETVVVSQSLDQRDDKTKLWHRRLGHISDKDKLVLSTQRLFSGVVTRNMKFYEACVKWEPRKMKFDTGQHTSNEILVYVH